jgi:hypothetical protein
VVPAGGTVDVLELQPQLRCALAKERRAGGVDLQSGGHEEEKAGCPT